TKELGKPTKREILRILTEKNMNIRNRTVKSVKVQWSGHTEEENAWEEESFVRHEFLDLFDL
ncbi:hypothetical protein PSY31_22740, partial [Shigella flexneri]|nr:hypothetical protein [Shigella flexneri]